MASRRIHELAQVARPDPADQVLISTASGNLTRRAGIGDLPFKAASTGSVMRLLADKLGEFVSVKDFGAVGDGTADDSGAFQAALDAHESVYVPRGRYRLASEIQVKPRRTVIGAGRDATVIEAVAARAFTFHRNAGAFAVEPGSTDDWCRSRLSQLSIVMAGGGLKVFGHEFFADTLRFAGGAAGAWCIELEDSNECSLREIAAGTGGGANDLLGNGIRLYGSEAGAGVNYGDSLIEEVSVKLKTPGSTGLLIEHTGPEAGTPLKWFVMNNLLLNRVQVNSAGVPPGTVGIHLKRVMRSVLLNVDVEYVDTAFKVEGVAGGARAGSCRHISFINCYVLNCTVPWVDSNPVLDGSVMRCLFQNCNGFGQLNPTGVASDDPLARCGEGDTFLPGALWINEPNNGNAAVQFRAPNAARLLVTSDHHDGESPIRDSNPKNPTPRRGFGVDFTAPNVTQIYRPRGYVADQLARIVVGNGEEGIKPDGEAYAPLHRVEIADPLMLTPRLAEPPQALNGMVVYATSASALPSGSPWLGAGWYSRLEDRWQPGVAALGRAVDKERNATFSLSPLDFGVVHRINNAGTITVTIPSTYSFGGTPKPLMATGDPDAVLWLIRQGTGEVLISAGDSGVEIKNPGGGVMKIRRQFQLVTVVLRFNSSSNKIEVYSTAVPDADQPFEQTFVWSNGNQGTNADTAPYVVAAARAGHLIRFSSSDPVTHVAFDASSLPIAANQIGAKYRLCPMNNPIRIMARIGGTLTLRRSNATTASGAPCFQVGEIGRVVTVHVIGADSGGQPNSIYVEA